jgi:hypothetical protein
MPARVIVDNAVVMHITIRAPMYTFVDLDECPHCEMPLKNSVLINRYKSDEGFEVSTVLCRYCGGLAIHDGEYVMELPRHRETEWSVKTQAIVADLRERFVLQRH